MKISKKGLISSFKKVGLISLFILYSQLSSALTLTAQTAFSQTVEINSIVASRITQIAVKPGQTVAKGDLLIALDRTITQAKMDHANAIVDTFKPAVSQARDELILAQELFDRESLSLIEMQQAENLFNQAEAKVKAALAEVVIAKFEWKNTNIYSPIDGRVLQVSTQISRYVNPQVENVSLMTIVASDQMLAIALINSEQWDPALIKEKAVVKYKTTFYPAKIIYLSHQRQTQKSGIPAFELKVMFTANSEIPANMPVTIVVGQEDIEKSKMDQKKQQQKESEKNKNG